MTLHPLEKLSIDSQAEIAKICTFISHCIEDLGKDGAIIGLSGGLDSAVTAALVVKSMGAEKVLLVNLPERDSKPIHQRHARQFAKELGTSFEIHRITKMVRASGAYKLLPLRFIPTRRLRNKAVDYGRSHFLKHQGEELLADRLTPEKNSWIAKGNAYAVMKHRQRMVKLYQIAEIRNLMVVGAANKTEWLTGTFSKWGVDHCADVMPCVHLYRTQLEQLAVSLGVPEYIRSKAADPDIIPGSLNKEHLLGGFSVTDQILYNLEKGLSPTDLYTEFPKQIVNNVTRLYHNSAPMRESPYHL